VYDLYTDRSRKSISYAVEEAKGLRSRYIEPEHLLLGVTRACEPELGQNFRLQSVERDLRAQLTPFTNDTAAIGTDIPLSNACKRALAYAAEEAERLGSTTITPGHLLLGILRESDCVAAHLLPGHNLGLSEARAIIAKLAPETHVPLVQMKGRSLTRRRRFGSIGHLCSLLIFGLILNETSASAQRLLWVGVVWLIVVIVWNMTYRSWAIDIKGRHRKIALIVMQALLWVYGFLLCGWLVPLALGLWRFFRR
jgi:ATP-dependent Clp protease ATP-binding subunit ClpC